MSVYSTTWNNTSMAEIPFPKLMLNPTTKQVVLFYREGEGTVVLVGDESDQTPVGRYYHGWIMSAFKNFTDTISLTNKQT